MDRSEILRQRPGTTDVHLQFAGAQPMLLKVDDGLRVAANPSLMADLKQLLGAGCLG